MLPRASKKHGLYLPVQRHKIDLDQLGAEKKHHQNDGVFLSKLNTETHIVICFAKYAAIPPFCGGIS